MTQKGQGAKKLSVKLPHYNLQIKERKQRYSLTVMFSLIVFIALFAAIVLAVLAVYVLVWTGVIGGIDEEIKISHVILLMAAISLVIGAVIIFFVSRIPLAPINELINKINRLASGDFKARMKFGKILSGHSAFSELSASFNTLAEELENTEIFRSDFINNFSHEFKTPIVSISGLAKSLKEENLNEEQRTSYLEAIDEEARRLASMATNILNLGKVENQTILTDITSFNISEQIRLCFLLLESKWTKKNIELVLAFDEYTVNANEELLKQVWINLIDNAIKFAPRCGTVAVTIKQKNDLLSVSVSNTGSDIPPEKQNKIWNKFYQCDESHACEGNGIGLAIVKRIVELHGGSVDVKSADSITVFTVNLPIIDKGA